VRLPNWVGDVVSAQPTVRAIHARWNAAGRAEDLTLVGPAGPLALLGEACEGARLIGLDRETRETVGLYRGHDAALFLDGSWRSAWRAALARIPVRVGLASGGRGVALTHAVAPAREVGRTPTGLGRSGRFPRRLPRPFGSVCFELASALGIEIDRRRPRLAATLAGRTRARDRLKDSGLDPDAPFVLLNAGARPGSAKAPPPELWGSVAAGLTRAGHAVHVVCGPGEEEAARAAVLAAGTEQLKLFDDPPPDLDELLALCEAARLVVTADSGPRHLAVACGTPVVAACGPTDPRHTADHLEQTRIVRVVVPCGPCHRERCPLPEPEHLACMRGLDSAQILAAAEALLG